MLRSHELTDLYWEQVVSLLFLEWRTLTKPAILHTATFANGFMMGFFNTVSILHSLKMVLYILP